MLHYLPFYSKIEQSKHKDRQKMTNNNQKYEICDAHCHIFPEKIAVKAAESIGTFYDLPMFSASGSPAALIKSGRKIGVSHYLVCSAATAAHQVESINRFILSECESHPEFIGFGTLHPDYGKIDEEIDFLTLHKLRGIKLHPDFQNFNIDDKRAYPIYEAAEKARLPILFHTGDPRFDYSSPVRLKHILKDFPHLTVIAAHFGGWQRWKEAASALADEENVVFDTSSTIPFLKDADVRSLISAYGTDRLFFGTDFPMWKHDEALEHFLNLGLTDREYRAILSENFKTFFSID